MISASPRRDVVHRIEPLETRIAPAALASLDLSTLNGANGFKLRSADADSAGTAVSGAGDVNGDGFADFLIGANDAEPNGQYSGASYVVFGKAGGFGTPFDLSSLNGLNGFKIEGEAEGDQLGRSVSGAGDVNGDGFADLLIGAPFADTNGADAGASYVVFGKAGGFAASFKLSSLNGGNGFIIQGEAADDRSGVSVSGAGDINGDGFADLLIGAYGAAPHGSYSGASYVVFGQAAGFATPLNLSALTGPNGFKIQGEAADDKLGFSVSGAGDVNGDGFADLVLGAVGASPNGSASGASYVVFGQADPFSTPLELSSLSGADGFKIQGEAAEDRSGFAVSGVGDVNGDGFADVLIGAKDADPNGNFSGASYVVFGQARAFSTPLNLSSLDGANGFKIEGEAAGDHSGDSVSGPGDFNGDGFADVLIGAYAASTNGDGAGTSYVVFGQAGGFSTPLKLSSLNGLNGLKFQGEAISNHSGEAVSGAGDVNGDGLADLLIGAFSVNTTYVVFGFSPIALSKDHKTATLPDSDGDIVTVKVSKGALTRGDFTITSDGDVAALDLRAKGFAGASVTISAKKAKGGTGDGLVEVDRIDARGNDLGAVSVSGRLEQLFAGDSAVKTAGVQSLTVGSLGQGNVLGALVDYHTTIIGALGALTVKGDARGMFVEVTGGQLAGIGKITIAGKLDAMGASAGISGFIRASGDIGPVKIGSDVVGSADFSGLAAGGKLGKVSIGGALESLDASRPVTISAVGRFGVTNPADAVAIAGVSVKTDVRNARILAGYSGARVPLNPDAGIGAISVLGKWEASSVAAGVQDTSVAGNLASAPDGFGRNDTLIRGDLTPMLFATIASITIKGTAIGSVTPTTDCFGITAQRVGKLIIQGAPVVPMGADAVLDPTNNDFHLVTL